MFVHLWISLFDLIHCYAAHGKISGIANVTQKKQILKSERKQWDDILLGSG